MNLEKFCDFSCKHARFVENAHCSDNIGLYCRKYKQIVLKYQRCLDNNEKPRKVKTKK